MKTFTPKPADLTHEWYVIDAEDAEGAMQRWDADPSKVFRILVKF